jgi:hypothetical protein
MFLVAAFFRENTLAGESLRALCGYKIKVEDVRIAEYIANIVTPYGFFPDVLRRIGRVLSKIYRNADDWLEIRKSTTDALDVIIDSDCYNEQCQVASLFYEQFGIHITPEEIDAMVRHLFMLRDLPTLDDYKPQNWVIQTIPVV